MQPQNNQQQPKLTLRMDRKFIWHRGESVRYLVAEIDSPSPPVRDDKTERSALNLAIVIDRSGSMSGAPLEQAKLATCNVVDRLADGDRISIVTFEDQVDVCVDGMNLSAETRPIIKERVMALRSGGCTDLGGGWLKGAECVAEGLGGRTRNQVMLLSDGHANQGITDPEVLAEYASGLLERGVITSCVGIGDGYSMDQIQALARSGGGRLHDAEFANEISEVMLGELGEAQASVIDNVVLRLELPGVNNLQCLGPFVETDGGFMLGSMLGNAKRRAVFALRFNAGAPGHDLKLHASLSCSHSDSGEKMSVVAPEVVITHATGSDNNSQSRDEEVATIIGEAWHAHLVQHATSLNREMAYQKIGTYLRRELRWFKAYVSDLPRGHEWLENLDRFRVVAMQDMGERVRKNIAVGAAKMQYMEAEHRLEPRVVWSDQY